MLHDKYLHCNAVAIPTHCCLVLCAAQAYLALTKLTAALVSTVSSHCDVIAYTALCYADQYICGCSLSALIDNRVFCVHGGLSPTISTLDQVWCSRSLVEHLAKCF